MNNPHFLFFNKNLKNIIFALLAVVLVFFWFSLPEPLFSSRYSTVIEDREGILLGAIVADDGQWRFPEADSVPEKFKKSIIQFEDKYFTWHPGFNPVSLFRALFQNLKEFRTVSGGSTLTMQVVRLSKNNPPRTVWQKTKEIILAMRLELSLSKEEILVLYASHAPFGGNVVGLEAASWRYFGRGADNLSWAECAMLAVLPNAPGLIFPGRNKEKLLLKRNRLLEKLYKAGVMDKETFLLSKGEPLPETPFPLPQNAKHLLTRVLKDGKKEQRILSTLDEKLQVNVNDIIQRHYRILQGNGIHNAAALVVHVETGEVHAYTGNIPFPLVKSEEGHEVDIITAPRSTGSILKPFLYAFMLKEGEILPGTLIADIPTNIGGYYPKNYHMAFDGVVPAKRAISRSLNVPAVRMLHQYGIEKFHHNLKALGMTTLSRPAGHYGLSVILGGAEGSLWDLAGIYASMARTLNHYSPYNGKYDLSDFRKPVYVAPGKSKPLQLQENPILDAASIYLTFEAMVEVSRPDEEVNWQYFNSSSKIAWKTGTSFGHRDGWAIGVTPQYVVAVWTGNSSGEGRPGLTGIATAAPILFDIFSLLKQDKWFEKPFDELAHIPVCRISGHRIASHCEPVDTVYIQETGLKTIPCPYHQLIHLDHSGNFRVNSDCEQVSNMQHVAWFILSPAQEWYYKNKNPLYKELPPVRSDCRSSNEKQIDLIYPCDQFSKIYIPVELDGNPGKTVFEAVHRKAGATLFWHLDNEYAGSTTNIHQLGVSIGEGKHILTVVDEKGESVTKVFEVVGQKNKN